jgi:hypothetical protein
MVVVIKSKPDKHAIANLDDEVIGLSIREQGSENTDTKRLVCYVFNLSW